MVGAAVAPSRGLGPATVCAGEVAIPSGRLAHCPIGFRDGAPGMERRRRRGAAKALRALYDEHHGKGNGQTRAENGEGGDDRGQPDDLAQLTLRS